MYIPHSYSQTGFKNGSVLINDRETAAKDGLKGILMCNGKIGMFDFGTVVVRRDYAKLTTVKVVSGGGSGYEPAYAGFVGQGMLTAAVQGEIFSSPMAADILRTIKELNGTCSTGVLLIIQNTTPDRLNFGLAMERARNEGIRVKMLVVAENCFTTSQRNGRRGFTGALLLQKIAGAMAEDGMSLDDIFQFCQQRQQEISSVVVALKSCSSSSAIQECTCKKEINYNTVHVGTDLHGAPGIHQSQLSSAKEVSSLVIASMTAEDSENHLVLDATAEIVVLVNNLGSASKIEELIFLQEFIQQLLAHEVKILRIFSGSYLTSLDLHGFSVTLMKIVHPDVIKYLDAPCDVSAWNDTNHQEITIDLLVPLETTMPKPSPIKGPKLSKQQSLAVHTVVQFTCDALIACEKQINVIDSESGKGNAGSRIKCGAEAVVAALKNDALNVSCPFVLFGALSETVEDSMGGTLGCIYSILFEAGAKVFSGLSAEEHVLAPVWTSCLYEANKAVRRYTNVDLGCRTMYDPLHACYQVLNDTLSNDVCPVEALNAAVSAAEEAAKGTKPPGKKYPDAGAHAVGIIMRAICEAVKLHFRTD